MSEPYADAGASPWASPLETDPPRNTDAAMSSPEASPQASPQASPRKTDLPPTIDTAASPETSLKTSLLPGADPDDVPTTDIPLDDPAPLSPLPPLSVPPTPSAPEPLSPSKVGFLPLVTVVGFHHARGPEVEGWFGAEEGVDPAVEHGWSLLPFMALSDGAHA